MYLEGTTGASRPEHILTKLNYLKPDDESSFFPASWGSDSVTISEDARNAALMATEVGATAQSLAPTESSAKPTPPQDPVEQKEPEDGPVKKFSDYLKRALGQAGGASSGSVEDQIKALEEKLAALQSKLASVASDKKTSNEAKQNQVETLEAEINQVTSQISELAAMLAESGDGGQG